MKRIPKLLSLHILLAGQEGFEPPTPGFGVRCSTVRATGLHLTGTTPKSEKPTDSFGLFVQGVFSAEAAILGKLKLVRRRPLIFHSRVISSLTLAACKGNDHSHCLPLNLDGFVKSPYAALRCILRHYGVPMCTPHSSGFARLASEAFYFAILILSFYDFSILSGQAL